MEQFPTKLHACPTCGVSVYHHEGQYYLPSSAKMLTGNLFGRVAVDAGWRHVWTEHTCEEADIEARNQIRDEVVTNLTVLSEDNPPQWLRQAMHDQIPITRDAQEALAQITLEQGLLRSCPKCGAKVGAVCENLTARRRGEVLATKSPHTDRLPYGDPQEPQIVVDAREHLGQQNDRLAQLQAALKKADSITELLALAKKI